MALATLIASPASATVYLRQSLAYDVGVDLTVLGGTTVTIGPFAEAAGIRPPEYDVSNSVASASATAALNSGSDITLANLGLSTGLVEASASSSYSAVSTTASSTIHDLALSLKTAGFIPVTLLSVGAKTIMSTSTASDVSPPATAVGSSSIEDLKITGLSGLLNIDIAGTINAPANDVIFNLLGLKITLNQQIAGGDGLNAAEIETNAIAIDFYNFALGTGVLNGEIIIGDSFASVPEPATWIEMLGGFSAVGFLMLGRAKLKGPAAA